MRISFLFGSQEEPGGLQEEPGGARRPSLEFFVPFPFVLVGFPWFPIN